MLQEAAREHGLELSRSVMVGNRASDIHAGQRAGCSTILLDLHVPTEEKAEAIRAASFVAKDWKSAVEFILNRPKS
jgi:histidinol phosphatase-like enzyme